MQHLAFRLEIQLAYVRELEADWKTAPVRLAAAREHAMELGEELAGMVRQPLRSPQPDAEEMRARTLWSEVRELTGEPLVDRDRLILGYLAQGGCSSRRV